MRRVPRRPLGHVRREDRRDEPRSARWRTRLAPPSSRADERSSAASDSVMRTARVSPPLASAEIPRRAREADRPRRARPPADPPDAVASSSAIRSSSDRGDRRADVRQARRRRRHEAREDRDGRRSDVRRAPGDHLEERRAERVEVRARVDALVAARLLGRHVRGRADDGAGARQLGVPRRRRRRSRRAWRSPARALFGPLPTRMMFDGLTSRWTMPAACAAASASATCAPTSRHCASGSGARFCRCAMSSPSSHSIAT